MKKSIYIAVVIALAALLWILSGTIGGKDTAESTSVVERQKNTQAEKTIASVRFREQKAQAHVNNIVLTGLTEASRSVTLRAEIEGMVTELSVEKGDVVQKGDTILKIEAREKQERFNEATERVKQREIEFNAAANLAQKGFNSKVRVAQAKADLEQARADKKQAELNVMNTDIKAPFDSVVFDTDVEIGDLLRIGDEIARMVDLNPIHVRGYVTEHHMDEIKKGNTARIVFVDGRYAEGVISYVAPAANPDTRTFVVEITIDNEDHTIVEGMTVQIFIPTPEEMLHKISPSVLSLDDEGRVGVKTLNEKNAVSFVPVKIVSDHADYMLIDGLPETARIITVGQDFVTDGQVVDAQQSEGDGLL